MMTLDKLPFGRTAEVVRLYPNCAMRERLQDLGVIPGEKIVALMRSPLGDPIAYQICGAVIALRRRDTVGIEIRAEEQMR